jgi:hypothetical protein
MGERRNRRIRAALERQEEYRTGEPERRLMNGGIELLVQSHHEDDTIDHSGVFVSWCLTPELFDRVQEISKNKAARLLIVIREGEGESRNNEKRHLFDISLGKGYISFDAPGSHQMTAMVVFAESENILINKLSAGGYGCFRVDVLGLYDDTVLLDERERVGYCRVQVNVPKGVFAEEPRDWWWVNALRKKNPTRNMCEYRRWRVFAYTLQPFIVVLMLCFMALVASAMIVCRTFVAIVMLSIGIIDLNFRALVNIKKYRDMNDIWWNSKGSVFMPEVGGHKLIAGLAFSPLTFALVFLFSLALSFVVNDTGEAVSLAMNYYWPAWACVLVSFLLANGIVALAYRSLSPGEIAAQARSLEQEILWAERERLVCTNAAAMEPSLRGVPLTRKTFHLHWSGFRQKHCEDFPTRTYW